MKKITSRPRVLIVADNVPTYKIIAEIFSDEEVLCHHAEKGREAMNAAASLKPDLMIISNDLSDMDGVLMVAALRNWYTGAIVVYSTKTPASEVCGLFKAGADDFINWPENLDLFKARCDNVMRRAATNPLTGSPNITFGPIVMDLVRHTTTANGLFMSLTPKEYELLRLFMRSPDRVITHSEILKQVWGPAHVEETQYLRVYIGQLRQKMNIVPDLGKTIVSRNGIGYILDSGAIPAVSAAAE